MFLLVIYTSKDNTLTGTALDGLARRRETPRVRAVQQDADGGECHQGSRGWKGEELESKG